MSKENIKSYILSNKNSYSKEQLVQELLRNGYDKQEIEEVTKEIYDKDIKNRTATTNNTWIIVLIIVIILVIILVPIILTIIGAFIFYQIDFESLEAEILDLTNNLKGNIEYSSALSSNQQITLFFTYNGNERIEMRHNSTEIFETRLSTITIIDNNSFDEISKCNAIQVKNSDTQIDSQKNSPVVFLRAHRGEMTFQCDLNTFSANELVTGNVQIFFVDPRTGISFRSYGILRIKSD
ncbi:MAG: hypothetical protein LAT82_01005 [Nanoarchaeota archaeon]|nr:hypothetical protein [Nanoarchaeota archaeon]